MTNFSKGSGGRHYRDDSSDNKNNSNINYADHDKTIVFDIHEHNNKQRFNNISSKNKSKSEDQDNYWNFDSKENELWSDSSFMSSKTVVSRKAKITKDSVADNPSDSSKANERTALKSYDNSSENKKITNNKDGKIISEKNASKKHSFLQGAMILGASMIVVKIMGMVFKILFANMVDGVGNGMFNIAYSLYEPLFMLATAGFPIAISRMVSECIAQRRFKDVKKIHKISIPFFVITGIVCFVAMILIGAVYTQVVGSSESQFAIICLAPTILFGCLMSIYRGYFEGTRNMTPTAVSEIIEASSKMFVGLSLAYFISNTLSAEFEASGTVFGNVMPSVEHASQVIMGYTVASGMIGISLGAFLGFIFLLLRYKLKGDGISKEEIAASPNARPAKSLFKRLALTAVPIGLGSIVMSIASFIDSTLVQRRILDIMNTSPQTLKDIYNFIDPELFLPSAATGELKIQTFLWGCYGYALTLTMLITAITQVFGTSALPSLTTAWTSGDKRLIKKNIETVLRSTTLVTFPAGLGLSVLAHPILSLVFSSPNVVNEVSIASNVLRIMGISAIFIATSTPICSMLQAVGRVDLPLKLLSVGMVIKIVLNYTLVGIPSINIQGAAVGSLVAYLFVTVAGIYFLCKETKVLPDFVPILIKPLIGAVFCAVAAFAGYGLCNLLLPSKISTVLAIIIAVAVYVITLFLIKGVTKEDILMLPKGNKIVKTLEKHHIIR